MAKPLRIFLAIILFNSTAFGACSLANDIKKNEDGSYTYTRDCHVEVGKTYKELDLRREQVDKLEKVVELKDLAISKQHERLDLWMQSHAKLEDRVNTIEKYNDSQKWIAFGLGVIVMRLAVKGAGQLR
jgi:hypothetical protein